MFLFLCISIIIIILIAYRFVMIVSRDNKNDRNDENSCGKYKSKRLKIIIGKGIYEKLKHKYTHIKDLYKSSPNEGIEYTVNYIDTDPLNANGIILAIHGIPGDFNDFHHFVDRFGDNYRIIVPNLPDWTLTLDTEAFWHSNDERVDFLKSFLNALSVKHIKAMVTHSAGVHIASVFWSNDCGVKVDSYVLITPPGNKLLNNFQLKYATNLVKCVHIRWKRILFLMFWPKYLSKYTGVPTTIRKNTNDTTMFWMTFSVVLSDFNTLLKNRFEILSEKRIPTLLVIGERDRLLPLSKSLEITETLGARNEHFTIIGENNDFIQKAHRNWINVLNFKNAGHFCFIKNAHIFHGEFNSFISTL